MFGRVIDTVLVATIGVIFLSALIGIWVRRRTFDRCLADFHGNQVTLELTTGKRIWGRLVVYPNGLEILYAQPKFGDQGLEKSSYVLFEAELVGVQAIYRFHDELNPDQQWARRKQIATTTNPSYRAQLTRGLKNFLNTFRDAFVQSIGVTLDYAKRTAKSAVLSQDRQLAKVGETVLGAFGNAYEPILERHIGRRVVVEEARSTSHYEHAGALKEYSAEWIELLDVTTREPYPFDLGSPQQLRMNLHFDFFVSVRPPAEGRDAPSVKVSVQNKSESKLQLVRVIGEGYRRDLTLEVAAGATGGVVLEDLPIKLFEGMDLDALPLSVDLCSGAVAPDPKLPVLPNLELWIHSNRELDLLLPRRRAVMRHGSDYLPED
jgi:hypothetical protein